MKIQDALVLKRGYDLPESKRIKGQYTVYSSNGVAGYHNKYKVEGPAVITGRSGSLGTVQYTENNCWPLNTTLFVSDFKGNNPKYIRYLLQTLHLEKYGSGSAVPTLNRNHLDSLEIPFYSLIEQQHIVDIIGSIDDKIENNNKIIEKIDKLGVIKYKLLNDTFDEFCNFAIFKKGKEALSQNYTEENNNDNINFIRVKDLNSLTNTYIPKNLNIPIANPSDILISFDGAIGRINYGLYGAYSSGIYKVIPYFKNNYGILYWALKDNYNQQIMLEHTNGTTILHGAKAIPYLKIKKHSSKDIDFYNNIFNYSLNIKLENIKLNILKQLYLKKFFR